MVFKKSITLLVATRTTRFFVVVPIISENRCSLKTKQEADSFKISANMPYIMLQKI